MQIPKGRRKDVPLWDGIAAGDPGNRRRYQSMPGSISAVDSLWAQTVAPARLRSAPVGASTLTNGEDAPTAGPNAIIPPGPPLILWGLRPQGRHPGPVRGGGAAVSHRLLPARCGVRNKKLREGEGGLNGGGGAGVGEGKFSGKLNSLDLPGGTDQRGLRPKALSQAGWGTCFPFSDPLIAPALMARKRDRISLLGSPVNIFFPISIEMQMKVQKRRQTGRKDIYM